MYHFERKPPVRQEVVLDFIRREVSATGRFPNCSRIATYMGWQDRSVRDCLERLVFRGALLRTATSCSADKRRRYTYSLPEVA